MASATGTVINTAVDTSNINVLFKLIRRARHVGVRQAVRALIPKNFDWFLYEATPQSISATPPVVCELDVRIEEYSSGHLSGDPYVDRQLVGSCEAFLVRIDGEIAHRCFWSWATSDPQLFGFDAAAPVLMDGWTHPKYRGKRLQPLVRRYMAESIFRRGVADRVYNQISPDNIASMKGNERGGFRKIARMQGVKIGGVIFRRRVTTESTYSRVEAPAITNGAGVAA